MSANNDGGWRERLSRWWNECDGHCTDFDPSDAYCYFGTDVDALELASRCYHKYRRHPYPDETTVAASAEGDQ